MGNTREIFARRLKELREGHGKGVRELGIELGMSHSAISLYENMKRTPDIEVCKKIAMKKSYTGFYYEYEYKGKSYKFYRKNTDEYIEYNLVPYINIDKIPELKEMPNIKAILDMVK